MPKTSRAEREEAERLHQGEHSAIADAQRRGALGVDDDRLYQRIQVVFADQAVVAQVFDAQEASVGGKADLPQRGQIAKSPTDLEVVRVVDRVSVRSAWASLWYCLTLAFLYSTWSEGTTPSVRIACAELPGRSPRSHGD